MARVRGMGGLWLAALVLGWVAIADAQGTAWIQVTVDTRTTMGEQTSTFRAFTTSDQAGTQRIPVDRICVKGIGHRVEERCAENADSVELVERATGLPGLGNLCVEAVASADSKVGPLSATARACP
jgi:hypothetical protein